VPPGGTLSLIYCCRALEGCLGHRYVTILTGFGLGQLLHYGREINAMDQVIGIMIVIIVIGLLADKILFSPWERFLHRRWGTGRI
jgi:NitT/TauT family transport system permease protein